jgi:hypothetical protein
MLAWFEVAIQLCIFEEVMYDIVSKGYDDNDILYKYVRSKLQSFEKECTLYKYESILDVLSEELDATLEWISPDPFLTTRILSQSAKAKQIVSDDSDYSFYRSNPIFCACVTTFSHKKKGDLGSSLKLWVESQSDATVTFSTTNRKELPLTLPLLQRVPSERMDLILEDMKRMIS